MRQVEREFQNKHFGKNSLGAYVPIGRSWLFQSGQRDTAGSLTRLRLSVAARS